MVAGTSLVKMGLVLCMFSWLFQVLGFTCPGWLVVAIDLTRIGTALGTGVLGFGEIVTYSAVWYARVCINGAFMSTCSSSAHHESSLMGFQITNALADLSNLSWVKIEVELTLALFFCSVGIFVAILGVCDVMSCSAKIYSSLASAAMLLSGILTLPAVINVGLSIQDTKYALALISKSSGFQFVEVRVPWALALSATGLVLALISSVILIIAACKQNEQSSVVVTPGNDLSPAILRMGNFPASIATIQMFDNTGGHMPPQYNPNQLPPIGSRDSAPIERGGEAMPESPFGPFVMYPSAHGQPNGYYCHLNEVSTPTHASVPALSAALPPPPYEKESDETKEHIAVKI